MHRRETTSEPAPARPGDGSKTTGARRYLRGASTSPTDAHWWPGTTSRMILLVDGAGPEQSLPVHRLQKRALDIRP